MQNTPGNMSAGGMGLNLARIFGAALGLAALAAPLAGQNLLYVENGDKLSLVRRAVESTPCVLEGGKWIEVLGDRFVLKQTEEYLPVLITVHNRYFKRGNRAITDSGPAGDEYEVNWRTGSGDQFAFDADFESPFALDNVVLMLSLESKQGWNALYLWGIGHLDAHQSRYVSIAKTVPQKLREIHLVLHIFVDGKEALNTQIPAGKRSAALGRMVNSRISAVRDAELQPLLQEPPDYPASIKTKVKGNAVVSFRVDIHGRVLGAAVTSATDPAFGTAALEAIRQWRFVPRVTDGIPVDTSTEMTFAFDPPS